MTIQQIKRASTRKAYGEALVELGKEDPSIVALDADLAKSTYSILFGQAFPERFFYVGIAEQNMVSMAAGLAACGKTVFASTFAVFAASRDFDQLRINVAWPELNVKIVASHGGVSVGEDGASAQSIEDYALMCALPSFRVVVPADAYAVRQAVRTAAATPGPFYIRTHRPETPVVYTAEDCPFELGKANVLREGPDATIIAVGLLVHEAVAAADRLRAAHGIECRVLDMHTLKPLDDAAVLAAARDTGAIVTAEEHQPHGGLGASVARVLAEQGERFTPLACVALPGYGTSGRYPEIMAHFHLTAADIEARVLAILKRKR